MYPESYFYCLHYHVTHETVCFIYIYVCVCVCVCVCIYIRTLFPRFGKILVIYPAAEVYGEGNERQLCSEIDIEGVDIFMKNSIPMIYAATQYILR